MRTTVRLDDDVFRAAKALAEARRESLGRVLSELARKGLRPSASTRYRVDFPVFEVAEDAAVFGPEEVERGLVDD